MPKKVSKGSNNIEYIHDAAGNKLAKKANGEFVNFYCGSVVYKGDKSVDYIMHPEGLVRYTAPTGMLPGYYYQYNIPDHLGNVRAVTDESNWSIQQNIYYPFGLSVSTSSLDRNKYLYNGKEIQNDVIGGTYLGWYDYGARPYDSYMGRFIRIDRFTEKYQSLSPYQYTANNPINAIDVNGDSITLSNSYSTDRSLMEAHNIWKESEAGKAFYMLFDIGGVFENISVHFGTDADAVSSGNMSDSNADTKIIGVNKDTGEKTDLAPQQWLDQKTKEGVDVSHLRSKLKKNEYLRFEINTNRPSLYKRGQWRNSTNAQIDDPSELRDLNSGVINKKAKTIGHEAKHVRIITDDFSKFGKYYHSPATQHYYMDNPSKYPFNNKFLK